MWAGIEIRGSKSVPSTFPQYEGPRLRLQSLIVGWLDIENSLHNPIIVGIDTVNKELEM